MWRGVETMALFWVDALMDRFRVGIVWVDLVRAPITGSFGGAA